MKRAGDPPLQKAPSFKDKTFKAHYVDIVNGMESAEAKRQVTHARDLSIACMRRLVDEDERSGRAQIYDVNTASLYKTDLLDAIAEYVRPCFQQAGALSERESFLRQALLIPTCRTDVSMDLTRNLFGFRKEDLVNERKKEKVNVHEIEYERGIRSDTLGDKVKDAVKDWYVAYSRHIGTQESETPLYVLSMPHKDLHEKYINFHDNCGNFNSHGYYRMEDDPLSLSAFRKMAPSNIILESWRICCCQTCDEIRGLLKTFSAWNSAVHGFSDLTEEGIIVANDSLGCEAGEECSCYAFGDVLNLDFATLRKKDQCEAIGVPWLFCEEGDAANDGNWACKMNECGSCGFEKKYPVCDAFKKLKIRWDELKTRDRAIAGMNGHRNSHKALYREKGSGEEFHKYLASRMKESCTHGTFIDHSRKTKEELREGLKTQRPYEAILFETDWADAIRCEKKKKIM